MAYILVTTCYWLLATYVLPLTTHPKEAKMEAQTALEAKAKTRKAHEPAQDLRCPM